MAKRKLSREEEIQQMVEAYVGAGEPSDLKTVDFSNPNRDKTCLEIDFPILPINQIAQIEGNAGKPIYQMSKWWARRRSSVFRSILLAAATKAPEDHAEAAKLIWENYYKNHQINGVFKNLKVADIFMGGGTTLVEGSRLGMQMFGNDLNPVAWLVVKNELSDVDMNEVRQLFDYIEAEVKPQIMPFYETEGPNEESGHWYEVKTGKKMSEAFDPLSIAPVERKNYRYEGPEVIYTFWAKHGPCSAPGCNHRTPLFSSPVIAVKEISVRTIIDHQCDSCKTVFDVELAEARMAPDEDLIISDSEKLFVTADRDGTYLCPFCNKRHYVDDSRKTKNKKVSLSLLIHPDWMRGAPGEDEYGKLGGTATSLVNDTKRWNILRQHTLKLIEVRGTLSGVIELPYSKEKMSTNEGTIPKRSTFICQEETCGRQQDVMAAIRKSKQTGPISPYALQCYSRKRNNTNTSYNGRYFKSISQNDIRRYNAVLEEWEIRSNSDLLKYYPKSKLPFGFMTHIANGDLPNNYGFTHWYTMFNPRQLLTHALLLKTIDTAENFSDNAKEIALGVFEQYLRNQNMFCFWNGTADKMEPMFSNNNYHPKSTVIENAVFSDFGRGNLASCLSNTLKGLEWKNNVWEIVANEYIDNDSSFINPLNGKSYLTGKSTKVSISDKVISKSKTYCGSSTELPNVESSSYDLVITDPPFGGLLHYSELADFFYVWLRLVLNDRYPEYFEGEYTPKTLEAVANKARNPEDAEDFYKRVLTDCWKESHRILKPGGILAFTFHHSEDEPWVDVLESLFDSGFFLEATYPIRSDETKGKGEFGSKTIEYDIIHVCRKRTEDSSQISWPRLRRQILRDVRQLQDLLEHHQQEGLPEADIEVIKRGKALEYFSRHYGKVYVEEGREFTVKEALAGINDLIQDQSSSDSIKAPDKAEPLTRQFLRIFANREQIERDQMQKYLRGSGVGPSDFLSRNWCTEISRPKAFLWINPLEYAKEKKSLIYLRRDLDQALFLIGACTGDSGINAKKEMNKEEFRPHPALKELLTWLSKNGPENNFCLAAQTAQMLFSKWSAENQTIIDRQLSLFDMEGM
jgi:DNA modification methylase